MASLKAERLLAPSPEPKFTLLPLAMQEKRHSQGALPEFENFLSFARSYSPRAEISLDEVPAPQKLAPYAFALSADVALNSDEDVATGRFVLLHDPEGQAAWEGGFAV